jgi:hypothetical protein
MEPQHLDPIAQTLITAYWDTGSYSAGFLARHGKPPTTMAKAHHARSVMQAILDDQDRYELLSAYAEFGRVAVKDFELSEILVLRSESAVVAEQRSRNHALRLDLGLAPIPAVEKLVIYGFTPAGASLAIVDACRIEGSQRLKLSGQPEHIGRWPYGTQPEDDGFPQGEADLFHDLGELNLDAEGNL